MKLTIDTIYKTIEIEESIKLEDFIKQLSDIIPNWKEYTLKPKVTNYNWNWPITYVDKTVPLPYTPSTPYSPFNPPIYCGDPLPNQQPINFSVGTAIPGKAVCTTNTGTNGISSEHKCNCN
jgi:hypothetical protein